MHRLLANACVALLVLLTPGCAHRQPPRADAAAATAVPTDFPSQLAAFIERLRADPSAPPGFAVVAVRRDGTVFEGAYGVRDSASGASMTLDTPIYNASTTKAYTGLLASVLDARGQLPLTTSLRDVWPALKLPSGLDPAAITVERLLSHTSGLRAGGLIYRSVTTGEVTASYVPEHLARYATREKSGFVYSNLGPFVYSVLVETRTGVPWREAIAREVFKPLGLSKTTARLEDFDATDVAHCHYWQEGAWQRAPHKPTAVMNAAGGMYTSGRDTGRFLKAFLTDGASADNRIPAAVLRQTWERFAEQDRELWGLHRDGYGLGWDLGTYDGHRFVARSGGYTGCRSIALFLPAEGFGIAVLSVGDTGVNVFNAAIVEQAIDYWLGSASAQQRSEERIAEWRRIAAGEFAAIRNRKPAPHAPLENTLAQAVAGTFENERLGRLSLSPEQDSLVLRAGVWTADIIHVGGDRFIAAERGTAESTTLRIIRDSADRVTAVVLDDDRFDRVR